MIRLFILLLAVAFALPVPAATTWTTNTSQTTDLVRVSVGTFTTGTEAAPTAGVGTAPNQKGLDLFGIEGGTVIIETAGTMTAGGVLKAYIYNPITTNWIPMPDMDITVPAAASHSASFFVWGDWSRIAFVPSGVGLASTIYISGRRLPLVMRN